MPITQDRLRNLVEESERNLTRMAHLWTLIEGLDNSPHISDQDKLIAIRANADDYLNSRDCTYTVLERERIKYNWKRNEREAEKQRTLRTRRAQGHPDLKEPPVRRLPQQRLFMPQIHPKPIAPPQLPATSGQTPNTPSYTETPNALERELARARELGEQERAKNAARLAQSATDMFPADD